MQRLIVDCASVKDELGRTRPATRFVRSLTAPEQTSYDALQTETANRRAAEADAAAAKALQRSNDLRTVRIASAWSSTVAAALDRLLSSQ
jgi:hypothetical protein